MFVTGVQTCALPISRVERLLREDAARFDALLDEAAPEADSFARLHGAVDAIRRAA